MSVKNIYEFPEGFLWGTSTSAYQIEGGISNDWSEWEKSEKRIKELKKQGKNPSDFISGQACDSYHLYKKDFELAKNMNTNAIRFGIEWARVQPKKGEWDEKELEHYRNVFREAKRHGFDIVLTLWHWTSPLWVTYENGWENKETVKYYLAYVEKMVNEFGHFVDYWITLNEPMVPVSNGYLKGTFPPGEKCMFKARRVMNNLVRANNGAYEIIHQHYPDAMVSITVLWSYYEPANKFNFIDLFLVKIFNFFANQLFFNKIKKHFDFVAFDYYFHNRVVAYPPFIKNLNRKTNDLGWEIFPEGIYSVIKSLSIFKKPIIVMENGLADKQDKYRASFIVDHLLYIHKAIEEGADVRGYFHWSLLDNFEWAHGYAPKFGLYEVDYKTMERKPRKSVEVYSAICRDNRIEV